MIRPITFEEQVVGSKNDGGVYRNIYPHDGILWGCGMTVTSTQIEIASGMFVLGGRMIWVDGKTVFEVKNPIQNGYARLKAKIDLNAATTQEECGQFATEIEFSTTELFPGLTQEDINSTGKIYEQELAVVKIEAGNVTGIVKKLENAGIDAEKLGGKLPEYYTPPGTGEEYYGETPPDGYLFANGAAVSRATYAKLFEKIGTAYGAGDGSATFNLPDKRGRAGVGKDTGTFSRLGSSGGAETHVLTTAQMPSHNHTQKTHNHTQNAHGHIPGSRGNFMVQGTGAIHTGYYIQTSGQSIYLDASTTNSTASNNGITAANNAAGSGLAHNNLQPYLVCNYIIKY